MQCKYFLKKTQVKLILLSFFNTEVKLCSLFYISTLLYWNFYSVNLLKILMYLFRLHQVLVVACKIFVAWCGIFSFRPVGSLMAAHGLSCPMSCEILVDWPVFKPVSLHCKADCLTTGPPGKSCVNLFHVNFTRKVYFFFLGFAIVFFNHVWLKINLEQRNS